MLHSISQLRTGKSNQFTTNNPITKKKTITVHPGEKEVFVNSEKPGVISRIWITIPRWFWAHWEPHIPTDPSILKKLILRIYWDGSDSPSVEAPIGDFFGIGHCEYRHYLSQYIGMSSGGFYSYFPMPYNKVRIEIENLHSSLAPEVFLNANYQETDAQPESEGRFHCLFRTDRLQGSDPLPLIEAQGRGHYVGCCISMQAEDFNYLSYLEAPEYVYIDTKEGEPPTFTGTGLEDYFNGGWYFRDGEFYGPLHGVPLKDTLRSMISMYRFHDQDAISFEKSLKIDFVSPWNPERLKPYWFSSTAYWYQDGVGKLSHELPSVEKLMSMYRVRDVDHQSIP